MKRWQDRGEVEDSEGDEDLSLDADTPSPERPPRKRAKLVQDDSSEEAGADASTSAPPVRYSDDEDESHWVQAKMATTYGRRGRSAKQTSAPVSRRQTPGNMAEQVLPVLDMDLNARVVTERREHESPSAQQTPRQNANSAAADRTATPTRELLRGDDLAISQDSRLREVYSDRTDSTTCTLSPMKQIVQPQFSTSVLLKRALENGLPKETSISVKEPDVDITAQSETLRQLPGDLLPPALPGLQNDDSLHLSDLLSSPLSERDVSPPPGFAPPRTNASARWSKDGEALSEAESLPRELDYTNDAPFAAADNARRSLRARKEKQLHPYMYDKAQYQKQFRERGLKPVRVVEQVTTDAESQSASHSAASQSSVASILSSPPASQTLRPPGTTPFQLDYFDAAGRSSDDDSGLHATAKRRKFGPTDHVRPGQLLTREYGSRPMKITIAHDEYCVPLSPPRTSSENEALHVTASTSRQTVPGFRLPLGRVPVAPPTPQISSDARPRHVDMESSESTTHRMLSVPGRRTDTMSPALSSSEFEEEREGANSRAEAKRLRREQKRMKGVLPASWLRIDFRKQRIRQSPSPRGRRRLSMEPSPSTEPQRGLARKLTGARTRQDDSTSLYAIGAGRSDDSDVSTSESSAVPRPVMLASRGIQSSFELNEGVVDDEEMENDFVDPMLADIPRPARSRKKGSNQPRITDAFRKRTRLRPAIADDGASRQHDAQAVGYHCSKQKKCHRTANIHDYPVQLSILDAPWSPSNAMNVLPQFMRVALRRARREPNHGRHSPTEKLLRLTTADETEEASSVLRAWRAGTIVPRYMQGPTSSGSQLPSVESMGDDRVPLSDLPANGHAPRVRRAGLKLAASASHPRQEPKEPPCPTQRANLPPTSRKRRVHQSLRLRRVQLETLESEFDQMHRSVAFERRMQFLTESSALLKRRSRVPGFQLARYLRVDNADPPDEYHTTLRAAEQMEMKISRRPRKSFARRLETGSRQYRQPSEPLPDLPTNDEPVQASNGISEPVLEGLGTFGTRYPVDFDVDPLSLGTFFQHTTFIGSGELNDALSLAERDLSHASGHMRVQLNGEMLEWGAWNEDVAASFTQIPRAIMEALQILGKSEAPEVGMDREQQLSAVDSDIDYLLRSVVRFCSKCVYFVDAVDRMSCAQSLHRIVIDLMEAFATPVTGIPPSPKTIAKALQYQLVIAKQATQICDHDVVPAAIRTQIDDLLSHTSKRLAKNALIGHFDELRSFYENNRRADRREAGVDGDAYALSSIVILNNTLPASGSKSLLWPSICSTLKAEITEMYTIGKFERLWYDLFSLLPALEFTAMGTVCLGSRLVRPQEDWNLPQALLRRTFQLYDSSSDVRGYSVNDYVRSLLSRCYTLIKKWGWWRCESALNIIYDFFSRRGLALLKKEDCRGSPKFLDDLGSDHVELEVQNDDRSFHIFLKMLASGLIGMSKHQLYGARKIQGIAWRFIPNHNRTYRKDVEVARSTLDALRNHHDLICTLYFASPPGHRPGVHLLQELVNHSTSHREACRLNVRSWANIASFQASTAESLEVLRPLNSWFAEIMKTTVAQYRLAKSEAQQAFDQAKSDGEQPSEALLESTIAKNQSQLAATLVDALAGLKRALNSAGRLETAAFMVQGTEFWNVFELFDPSQRRLVGAMTEALCVVDVALDVEQRPTPTPESQQSSSDSQDFGDSDALQEFVANEKTNPDSISIVEALLEPVGHFMSNALGADVAPDDNLLQKAIDVWVHLAGVAIKHAQKTWLNFVDEYSVTGWGQLRDTAQKRKFTTYFMSRVVEQCTPTIEISLHVITAWLLSLVEREALLKFQHILTSALLNHFGHDRLLQNLPFAKDNDDRFNITLRELRQRRLALISSVLCNMRVDCERATLEGPQTAQKVRAPHEKMLRQLMQAMKSNYLELQTRHGVADVGVQGAYVEFAQHVISFLQQHTTGICKIDSFFTDSTVFPLPSDDPTYVVGRLKSYVPKLYSPKIRKELAAFVQSVSERAALDGQQTYLVNQMSTAMRGVREQGDRSSPSLRHLLLTTIFPAYIENAFATDSSWIPVMPILQACEQVIPDLLYSIEIEDESSAIAANESAIAVLHGFVRQFDKVLSVFPGMLGLSHVLSMLSAMLRVGTSCLTLASLLRCATSQADQLMNHLQTLYKLSVETGGRLDDSIEAGIFAASVVCDTPTTTWPDAKSYTETHLRDDMNPYWYAEQGRYYLKRYNRIQEAVVPLRDSEEERKRLLRAIADFRRAYDAIFSARGHGRRNDAIEDRWIKDVVV